MVSPPQIRESTSSTSDLPGAAAMSESDSWSEHDEAAADGPDAPPVAEQMRAATRSLRAHLSVVRDNDEQASGSRN
jgi:hypothetical protein